MKIQVEHITKEVSLPNKAVLTILQDISFKIDKGEILGVLGVSGSGKSTLLGLLAGLDRPSTGHIYWDQTNLTLLNEDERAQLRLFNAGFVFQNFELLPQYTAYENVLLPLELTGSSDSKNKTENILQSVGLEDRLWHYPMQLSGGEQQRVAIARAFVMEPKILFIDEPTGNLDQKTGEKILQLLVELNQKHSTTIVCVTHDQSLSKICDRILELSGGQLISESAITVK